MYVYLLTDYGNLVEGTNNTGPPYVQLLPTTNPAAAHADFVAMRVDPRAPQGSQYNSAGRKGSGTSRGKGFFRKTQDSHTCCRWWCNVMKSGSRHQNPLYTRELEHLVLHFNLPSFVYIRTPARGDWSLAISVLPAEEVTEILHCVQLRLCFHLANTSCGHGLSEGLRRGGLSLASGRYLAHQRASVEPFFFFWTHLYRGEVHILVVQGRGRTAPCNQRER